MKNILLILLIAPLYLFSQNYTRVTVYDESGNDLGTYNIQSDYTKSVNMAIDKYIRYLEEVESKEFAERNKQRLQSRLKELGMPSYLKSTAAIEGYNLARYGNVNGKQDNTSSVAYNQLLIEYKALKLSYDRLAKKYNQLLNQRNTNRTSSNSSANRQSSAYSNTSKSSSNYIKPGISFTHLKQPKMFGGEWGRYTSGATNIEFINDELYNNYYRKVRIKGNIGYINMNTFKQ